MVELERLKRVVENFGEKFQRYALDYGELTKQKAGMEKELEKLNGKLDSLKNPEWIEEIIEPNLTEMEKRLPGMEYDYWEPHGADGILTVFFYPKGRKSA